MWGRAQTRTGQVTAAMEARAPAPTPPGGDSIALPPARWRFNGSLSYSSIWVGRKDTDSHIHCLTVKLGETVRVIFTSQHVGGEGCSEPALASQKVVSTLRCISPPPPPQRRQRSV